VFGLQSINECRASWQSNSYKSSLGVAGDQSFENEVSKFDSVFLDRLQVGTAHSSHRCTWKFHRVLKRPGVLPWQTAVLILRLTECSSQIQEAL